jgi:hypothetical protein
VTSAIDLDIQATFLLGTDQAIIREQALANLTDLESDLHQLLHESSPLQKFISGRFSSDRDLKLIEKMFEETQIPMQQRFLLAFLNQGYSEGFDSLTNNSHYEVQEGKLSLHMRG